jgi:exosome complex RNA-binding protein Csl4
MDKKLCLPGTYLGGCEEFVAGANTYVDNDSIYAAIAGEATEDRRTISVANPKNEILVVKEGLKVYCTVKIMKDSKAILECTPVDETGKRLSLPIVAALPIQNVKKGYVKKLSDEMRIGDVVKAVVVTTNPAVDVSTAQEGLGVILAFCINCRSALDFKAGKLACGNCGTIAQRNISKNYRGSDHGSENNKQ